MVYKSYFACSPISSLYSYFGDFLILPILEEDEEIAEERRNIGKAARNLSKRLSASTA